MTRRFLMSHHDSERGIALIAVIAALSALLLIAVPFSLSMRDHRQSATAFSANARARMAASGILAHAKAQLHKTHESIDETPEYDSPAEFAVDFSDLPFEVADPKGMLWSVQIEDEQGKIHLDSASPYLLGNILGMARLSATVTEGDATLPVDDAAAFSPEGGFAWVGGELIKYQAAGNRGLTGCERGFQVDWARFLDPMEHDQGAVVLDARAVFINYLPIFLGRAQGRIEPLVSRTAVKRIHDLAEVALTTADVDKLLTVSTLHSLRPGGEGFNNAQTALDSLAFFEESELGGRRSQLTNGRYYGSGTQVEVSDGAVRAYTLVNRPPQMPQLDDERVEQLVQAVIGTNSNLAGAGQVSTGTGTITMDGIEELIQTLVPPSLRNVWVGLPLDQDPGFDVGEGRRLTYKTRGRHPININTASDQVLELVLTNLQLANNDDFVSAGEAQRIIGMIRTAPVTSHQDLLERILLPAVDGGAISEADLAAIYLNALNACDAQLAFSTAPFLYRSMNVFSIEATAIVNNAAGMELHRETLREVVHVGPGRVLDWRLETQEDFENHIIAGRGGKYMVSHPNNVARYDSVNRPPSRFVQNRFSGIYASREHESEDGDSEGDVRLRPSRNLRRANVEHFDDEPTNDGLILDGGGYDAPMIRALETDLGMSAGFARFWFQLPDGGSNFTLFDGGETDFQNRVRLFYDPGEGALRLQVYDATLRDRSLNNLPNAVEAVYPINIEPETWYHVTAAWRGSKPGDLTLLVDGINRTEHSYKTKLTSAVGTGTDLASVSVENAESFPPSGVIIIGGEPMEYSSRTNNRFNLRADPVTGYTRGAGNNDRRRGANAEPHENDTTVELFGYIDALQGDLRKGGARLASSLGAFDIAMVVGAQPTISAIFPPGQTTGPPRPATNNQTTSSTLTIAPMPDSPDPNNFHEAFQDEGFAILASAWTHPNGTGSRWELIAYSKTSDTTLEIGQRSSIPSLPNGVTVGAQIHFYDPSGQVMDRLCVVVPISLQASGGSLATDYINPWQEYQDGENLAQSERVQVGTEWFRYEEIRESEFFVRNDVAAFNRVGNQVLTILENGNPGVISADQIRAQLGFRGDANTFVDEHASGAEILPCFRVHGRGPGFGDVVTIMTPSGPAQQAEITQGAFVPYILGSNARQHYVSFDRALNQEYESNIEDILLNNQNGYSVVAAMDSREMVRLAKFPSGELPLSMPNSFSFGTDMDGGNATSMILDEVEINRMREVVYMVNDIQDDDAAFPPSETDIPLMRADVFVGHGIGNRMGFHRQTWQNPRFTEMPTDGGLVWAGSEIIAYREIEDRGYDQNTGGEYVLKDCIRGAMGSDAQALHDGDRVYLLSFLNVSTLQSGVSETSFEFPLTDARGFPSTGTISVIGNGYELEEMVHYTGRGGNSLLMPVAQRTEVDGLREGLFRGRYGTTPAAYSGRDLVMEMPHRFWDRSVRESDDAELSYLEMSRTVPGAYWLTIDWTERLPRSLVDVELLVRIDGRAPWNAEPRGKENGLFRFESPASELGVDNRIDMQGDTIEVRVFFPYKLGAYDAAGSAQAWKDTAWFQDMDVRYLSPRTVNVREVLP